MDANHNAHQDDALRAVGALILTLGQLETDLTMSIIQMRPSVAGPHVTEANASRMLLAIIRKWHTVYCETTAAAHPRAGALASQIEEVALQRNTIAHGFDAIWLDSDDYALVCFNRFHVTRMMDRPPEQKFISRDDLRKLINGVEAIKKEIRSLTETALARPRKPKRGKGVSGSDPNRESGGRE